MVQAQLADLPRMFIEPDGSFVWVGQDEAENWQLDGVIYDRHDRVIHVQCPDGRMIHHRYDAVGRRAETLAEQVDGAVVGERFFYDGNRLARREVFDPGTDATLRDERYVFDPEGERPLFRLVRAGDDAQAEAQYYTTDQRGAAIRLTDEQGRTLWSGRYDAYGQCREGGREAGRQPLRLAGQIHDAATGLAHHLFRAYDPDLRRFLTPDPIGLLGGASPYGYPTDPIRYADVLGLADEILTEGTIYRLGSGTDDSMTPRPGKDTTPGKHDHAGLSMSVHEPPATDSRGRRNKYVPVDVAKLQETGLVAVRDSAKGHVTVYPVDADGNYDQARLDSWAKTRGTGEPDELTTRLQGCRK